MTGLEQVCSVVMLLAGVGAVLMLYAALALDRQRVALAAVHRHQVRQAYRAHDLRRRLLLAGVMLAGVLAYHPGTVEVIYVYSTA